MTTESKKLTKDEMILLKKYYIEDQISLTKITKLLPYSIHILSKNLKLEGIEVINRQNKTDYNMEKDIIPLYNQGVSLTKIAKLFNTSRDTLSSRLKKMGIEVINIQNSTKFNENIFDVIDTEEKAYWLGFLYADGYIETPNDNKKSYSMELALKLSDVEHLIKFNDFMQHNKNNVKVDSYRCR